MEVKRINCSACSYYYVTWDANFPKGCKAHKFKTKHVPSLEVFRASGHPCYSFKRKSSNERRV